MKKNQLSIPTHLFTAVLCAFFFLDQDVLMVFATPEERLDTIGVYSMSNKKQCQRVCWYRQLCTSFSYLDNTGNGGVNCVLHSSHVEDADTVTVTTSPQWLEQIVLPPPPTSVNSCSGSRPCGAAGFCVPQGNGAFRCASLPAKCGDPDPIPNASLSNVSKEQGDVVSVQCVKEFVQSPRYVSMEIECQINSRWTGFQGECMQAVYHSPSARLLARVPWSLNDRWNVCVKGTFDSYQRMTYDFVTGSGSGADLAIQVDFRLNWGLDQNMINVVSKIAGTWANNKKITSPQLPLQAGDDFQLTFHVNGDYLRLSVLRNQDDVATKFNVDISLSSGFDLTRPVLYIRTGSDASLNYVNVAAGC
ncbi:hypothetical protein V1264_020183 [Littorina saxatilis]|uniref:Galectin n=1 Tax=Littorina saxatilis TaxID=31220 RepID=A0AAN9GAL1_9CAEN